MFYGKKNKENKYIYIKKDKSMYFLRADITVPLGRRLHAADAPPCIISTISGILIKHTERGGETPRITGA